MDIKRSNMITGAAAVVAMVAVVGFAMLAYAQTDSTSSNDTLADNQAPCFRSAKFQNLSDEEKADLQVKWDEKKALMEEKRAAIDAAFDSNDYNAWLEAVGSDNPMAEKINADNFSKLVEAHNLHLQAKGIMDELGIERKGFGHGMHMGVHF
ncbi:MAG: hypothetical protein ABH830_03425 [Patescibacteria group bacterium]